MAEDAELSWARLAQEIELLENISDSEKERLRHGWAALESYFGSTWLETAHAKKHPWAFDFFNKAPWVKSYYGLIGEMIEGLGGKPGLDEIVKRLKSPKKPWSAQAELNAGWKLFRSGVEFEFRPRSQERKTSDIMAYINGQRIEVEVTVLEASQAYRQQMNNFTRISKALTHPGIYAAGKIHRNLSIPHAEDLMRRIKQAIEKSLKENRLIRIHEHDVGEFCFAPKGLKSEVDGWKKERDMRPETNLMSHDFNGAQGRRLHRKIQNKCKQITADTPGIVYIEGAWFWITGKTLMANPYLNQADFEEAVYENKNLLFVCLGKLGLGHGLGVHQIDSRGNYLAKHCTAPDVYEETWLVRNRFHLWGDLEHEAIVNAFWYVDDSMNLYNDWEKGVLEDLTERIDESGKNSSE